MAAVEADNNLAFMGFGGKVCHIEQLSAAKEHGGEQSHGHVVGHQVYNCLFAERIAIGAAGKNQLGIGVEAAQFYLAFEGVNVGGEVECIGQYFCFTTGRFVKGTQEACRLTVVVPVKTSSPDAAPTRGVASFPMFSAKLNQGS